MDLLTLPQAKEKAAVIQGFESWASYEKYCKVTDVVKAYPLKMVAMCDVYANLIIKERDLLKKLVGELVTELDNSQACIDFGTNQYRTNKLLIAKLKEMP